MSVTFVFPGGNQIGGDLQSNILLSRSGFKSTLIQTRRLDIFFRMRPPSRNKGTDTAGKGIGRFVQLIRADERVCRFTNLGRVWDIGILDKVFDLVGSMRSARFR